MDTTFKTLLANFLKKRWVRFGIVGGAATFSYFSLGLLFVTLLRMPVLAGNGLAYALSFVISYLGQALWTFESGGRHRSSLPKFALAQLFGLALNSLVVELCMRLDCPYELAMAVAIIIVPVAVYVICKYWVFTKSSAKACKENMG